jgi:spore germination protein
MSERCLTRRAALGVMAAAGVASLRGAAGSAAPRLTRQFYWVNGASPVALLSRKAVRIDLVSPQWFHVQANGRLRADLDRELLAAAAELRIPLVPVVVNEGFRAEVASEVLGREGEWPRLAEELSTTAMAYGLRGLQIDFEGLAGDARASYARFVARLARTLRSRRLLCSVAVGAPLADSPNDDGLWQDGPHAASLDYAALAESVDSMTLMAYDQHVSPGSPGPVAGQPWVEACVRRVLEQVPASRLLLGIPLYYRRWSGDVVVEGPHAEAVELATRVGATVRLDPREGEKTFQFVEQGLPNVVWLQDRETLRERVALASRLGLAGFSAWRLGHEDAELWKKDLGLDPRAAQGTKATAQR